MNSWPHRTPKLFLVDAAGALTSAVFLGLIWIQFQHHIGMPTTALYWLASGPIFLAAFDLWAYQQPKSKHSQWLRLLAMLNGAYCLLSLAMLWRHASNLTPLGWLYFGVEIALVLSLAWWEWQAAKNPNAAP